MVYSPSNTTIYIDVAGTEGTRTPMRAELVAIHMALSKFATHDWLGFFIDSLSNLQAIGHQHTNTDTIGAKHYLHHRLLLGSISIF